MENEPMHSPVRPHTSMKMKNYSLYLPVELVAKAKLKGINLSAVCERELHRELRDVIFLNEIKKTVGGILTKLQGIAAEREYTKEEVVEACVKISNIIDSIEGEAWITNQP